MERRYFFGIDLGTTNSVISVYDAYTKVHKALTVGHSTLLKSAISFIDEDRIEVGKITSVETTIKDVKSSIGDDTKKYTLGSRSFTPVKVSALVLKKLKEEAQRQFDGLEEVNDVTITVPAKFDHKQRSNTVLAAKMAGLNVISLINEPTAAALAYIDDVKESETVIVYDLGGGTFDVSIVSIIPSIPGINLPKLGIRKNKVNRQLITVLCSDGDICLGGNDIDEYATTKTLSTCTQIVTEKDKERVKRLYQELKESGEPAKSYTTNAGERITLTDDIIAEATYVIYKRTRQILKNMIQKNPSVMYYKIVLVGGSTKSEYIKQNIKEDFPDITIYDSINPDECVSLGASKNTYTLLSKDSNLTFYDVSSDTVGVEVVRDGESVPAMDKMISKGTSLPAKHTKSFYKLYKEQTEITIPIYQGEYTYCGYNVLLGKLTISDIPKDIDEYTPISVTFLMDKNGILTCTAEMLDKVVTTTINSKSDLNTGSQEDSDILSSLDSLITEEF